MKKIFIFMLLLFFWEYTYSQEIVLDLATMNENHQLKPTETLLFTDKSKSLKWNNIIHKSFEIGTHKSFNFQFDISSVWIKMNLVNPTKKSIQKIIQVRNPTIDIVGLYEQISDSKVNKTITGDAYPFKHRKILNRVFQFPITIPANCTKTYYLNVQNSGDFFAVPISINSTKEIHIANELDQIIIGVYFGFIIFSIFLNLFFYLILKEKITLYYLAFVIFIATFNSTLYGTGFEYLWPNQLYFESIVFPTSANFLMVFVVIFFQKFLSWKERIPKMNKVFNVLCVILIMNCILTLCTYAPLYRIGVLLCNLISFVIMIMGMSTAFYIYFTGFKPARFIIVAFLALAISGTTFVLRNEGILPNNLLTEYGMLFGSGIQVIFISLAIVDSFQQFKQKALETMEEVNRLKTEANIELEQKVEERTFQLNEEKIYAEQQREIAETNRKLAEEQKEIIVESQQEILDSIQYASFIQRAMLTSEEYITKNLKHDYFIFYQPKDIVSGDFYWAVEHKNAFYFSTSDCTGHGVPGAFMSLLNISFLNENVIERNVLEPADILNEQREAIIKALNPTGTENSQDGMDCVLTKFDFDKSLLTFSGANNNLYMVRDKEILEYKGDKMPVGIYGGETRPFEQREIELKKGDLVYTFTDGLPDQFGGPKGKKFKCSQLIELLKDNCHLSLAEQKVMLTEALKEWMEGYEQIDDILVIGLRI